MFQQRNVNSQFDSKESKVSQTAAVVVLRLSSPCKEDFSSGRVQAVSVLFSKIMRGEKIFDWST
jgi:hypothetical protein